MSLMNRDGTEKPPRTKPPTHGFSIKQVDSKQFLQSKANRAISSISYVIYRGERGNWDVR